MLPNLSPQKLCQNLCTISPLQRLLFFLHRMALSPSHQPRSTPSRSIAFRTKWKRKLLDNYFKSLESIVFDSKMDFLLFFHAASSLCSPFIAEAFHRMAPLTDFRGTCRAPNLFTFRFVFSSMHDFQFCFSLRGLLARALFHLPSPHEHTEGFCCVEPEAD